MKTIYLIKCEGYCFKFSDGSKKVFNTTINYHCCEDLEEAKSDVRRWQREERLDNLKKAKEGKGQTWHNYKIETLDYWEKK